MAAAPASSPPPPPKVRSEAVSSGGSRACGVGFNGAMFYHLCLRVHASMQVVNDIWFRHFDVGVMKMGMGLLIGGGCSLILFGKRLRRPTDTLWP